MGSAKTQAGRRTVFGWMSVIGGVVRDRRGVTAIIAAIGATVLLGFTGLAVDVAYWETTERAVQGAADQASLAAALKYEEGASQDQIVAEGKAVAAKHGFVDGQNGVTVTVNWPPKSGAYTGDTTAVEVIIQTPMPTFFAQFFLH
jgi:Flp pilus assembly protein TadG